MNSKVEMRHTVFAQEYVIDFSAGRAAIAAGYGEARAEVTASELLKVFRVVALIDNLQSKRAPRLGLRAEQVVEELARIAFANVLDYMQPDEHGEKRMNFSNVTRDQAAAIAEIRTDTPGGSGDGDRMLVVRTTLKPGDKLKALELLMRYLGMYQENVRIDANMTKSVEI